MKKALLLHGAYGNPTENWFPWLQQKLNGTLNVIPNGGHLNESAGFKTFAALWDVIKKRETC